MVTDDPRIGVVLDHRYTLVERLGAGGMGVVYKAGHCYTGELVAVKLLHADAGGARSEGEIRMRFGQEPHLQVLARHANVVRVIDAGVDESQPYLVTEYVDGEDLQRRLDARVRFRSRRRSRSFAGWPQPSTPPTSAASSIVT